MLLKFYTLKKTLFFILIFVNINFYSQNYSELYPNEDVITLKLYRHIKISNKKGNFKITEHVKKKNLFLTTSQLSHAKQSVSYNTFSTIKNIQATTLNNNTSTFVNSFTDKDVLINGIFFNDQKEKSFIFPNVKKGSITHLDYTKDINDPHFLPAFTITQNTPLVKGEFSVSVPNNVEIAYKTFNIDTTNTALKVVKQDKETIYKWTTNSIPKINRHYDLSPFYYIPQIIVYIKSYTYKDKKINILSEPKDLYKWYTSLIATKDFSNAGLKAITLDIIDGLQTEQEKIEKIYYYVQNNINYVAFEDGLNGFIPRDAFQVYLKKYGDCKDMANILNEMLKYANIKSGLTWIGTRRKPYSYYDVPTPIADNHMITTVYTNGKPIFLDATAKYLTYGLPSPFIQGKEALISKGANDFEIIKVPEVNPNKNKTEIISNLTIDTNSLTLKGTHKSTLSGYEKLEFLHELENKDKNDLSFLYYQLKYGTKKTSFENIKYENLNIEKPYLNINFTTNTKGHIKKIENVIYIKPNLDFNLKKEFVKNESKNYDKKINHKFLKEYVTTLVIPNGYFIESLPKNKTFNNKLYNLNISYKLSEDKTKIEIKKKLTLNTLLIKPTQIEEWNLFIKFLNKANKQNLLLKKQL